RRPRAWHWQPGHAPRAKALPRHPRRCRQWRASAPAVDARRSQCDLVAAMDALKLLILGGSGEAAGLARAVAGDAGYDVTLSIAGRTAAPVELPGRLHRGGFGGIQGLARYLAGERFDCVVDATHPFAVQMKSHAVAASKEAGIPLLAIRRPAW